MRKKKGEDKKCVICGKVFYAPFYHTRQGWAKCCSKECRDKSLRNGKVLLCAYCGEKVYRSRSDLKRISKTNSYFCSKSCHCAWKNRKRKKKNKFEIIAKLWGSWCNGSTTCCGRVSEDSISSGPPGILGKFLSKRRRKSVSLSVKRPAKKELHDLYWKKEFTQSEIGEIFDASHTSVKRWLQHYNIQIKPRSLSCGRHPNGLKNLKLGLKPEIEKRASLSRTIYSKEIIIARIKEFVEKERRVPSKKDFNNKDDYPDHVTCRNYFGTWGNAILAAGFVPYTSFFASVGCREMRAKDGHVCRSISEIIIDNWLSKHEITHKKDYPYPNSRRTCDFVVNDIFIEFFGLKDCSLAPRYRSIIKEKQRLCKRRGISLIDLYDKDLKNLENSLGSRIEQAQGSRNFSKVLIKKFYRIQTAIFD